MLEFFRICCELYNSIKLLEKDLSSDQIDTVDSFINDLLYDLNVYFSNLVLDKRFPAKKESMIDNPEECSDE